MNPELEIVVNGEARRIGAGATIASLLAELGVVGPKVAVERNLAIAPRSSWDDVRLQTGDKLEIVEFVGGG